MTGIRIKYYYYIYIFRRGSGPILCTLCARCLHADTTVWTTSREFRLHSNCVTSYSPMMMIMLIIIICTSSFAVVELSTDHMFDSGCRPKSTSRLPIIHHWDPTRVHSGWLLSFSASTVRLHVPIEIFSSTTHIYNNL